MLLRLLRRRDKGAYTDPEAALTGQDYDQTLEAIESVLHDLQTRVSVIEAGAPIDVALLTEAGLPLLAEDGSLLNA